MKFAVVLENLGGELDRTEVNVPDDSDDIDAAVDDAATAIIESWVLSVGDTIRIVEAE